MTAHTAALEAAREAMRQHIKCDATGLSPAVASVFLTGFDDAARAAIWAYIIAGSPDRTAADMARDFIDEMGGLNALADEIENRIPAP